MKKTFLYISFIFFLSCEKQIENLSLSPYTPESFNEKGGTWKTYILKKPDEIIIAKPLAVTSKEYLAELAELKQWSDSLTTENKAIVDYWSVGTILRWNEIARTLIAKYNVAPQVNSDGNYPIANPLLPNEYPKYPYSNDLYGTRALALLNVGMYDAQVSTWHYKNLYKRPSPYTADTDLKTLLPKSELSSFPSEEASSSTVAFNVLSYLFPSEKDFLLAKLTEVAKFRLLSGLNVRSDLAAGAKIGDEMSKKVLAYANTDGFFEANKQTIWLEQRDLGKTIGILKQWESAETPARPPLLPNFSSIKPWNFDKKDLKELRLYPEFLPESKSWNEEIEASKVLRKKIDQSELKLINKWNFGKYTYGISGYWNKFLSNLVYNNKMSEIRAAHALAILHVSLVDAAIVSWESKYFYQLPRPKSYGISSSIDIPNSPGYSSFHTAVSYTASGILGGLFPSNSGEFSTLSAELSQTMILAGVDLPIDARAGKEQGNKISSYGLIRGEKDGSGLITRL